MIEGLMARLIVQGRACHRGHLWHNRLQKEGNLMSSSVASSSEVLSSEDRLLRAADVQAQLARKCIVSCSTTSSPWFGSAVQSACRAKPCLSGSKRTHCRANEGRSAPAGYSRLRPDSRLDCHEGAWDNIPEREYFVRRAAIAGLTSRPGTFSVFGHLIQYYITVR
jgi:hypothetical protein